MRVSPGKENNLFFQWLQTFDITYEEQRERGRRSATDDEGLFTSKIICPSTTCLFFAKAAKFSSFSPRTVSRVI